MYICQCAQAYERHVKDPSDNVMVPIDEFRKTLDGAIRIARSFDDGLSECGLVCPWNIAAIDQGHAGFLPAGQYVKPLDTKFPCYR